MASLIGNLASERPKRFLLIHGQIEDQPLACRSVMKSNGPQAAACRPLPWCRLPTLDRTNATG